MHLERIEQNLTKITVYALILAGAVVVGYWLAQGWIYQILTVATLLGLGGMLLFLTHPLNGLLLLIGCKAVSDRFDYPLLGPLSVNALLYVAVAFGGATYYVLNRERFRHNAASAVYFAFIIFAAALILIAPDKIQAFAGWSREFGMVVLYFLCLNLMGPKRERKKYVVLVCVLGAIGSIICFAQQLGLYPYLSAHIGRSSGTFAHPNFFAYFQLVPLSLGCAFLMAARTWRARGLWVAYIGLCTAGLLTSYSRGGWLASLVMFCVLGALGRKWFLIGITVVVLGVYVYVPSVQQRLFWLVDRPNAVAATAGRTEIWRESLPKLKEQLLLGHGLQSFMYYSLGGYDAHNSYLKLLFETGLVGFLLYSTFLGLNLVYALQVWRRSVDSFDRAIALAFMGFYIAYLAGSFGENLFLQQGTEWFSNSTAGILAALARQLNSGEQAPATAAQPAPQPA
jgi:O-antigen ligase